MRVTFVSIAVALAACGGQHGESICGVEVPPPPACTMTCDPSAGAPNTCPAGFHCNPSGTCDASCTQGGTECGDGFTCSLDGTCISGTCTGVSCNIVNCQSQGKPATTIKGTVFAPNGTLPLYGIQVYVPNGDPGPLPDGAVCSKCADSLPGSPVVKTLTDEAGNFTLTDPPSGNGISVPVVIVSGKWRRVLSIPNVASCADNTLTAADTSLPKSKDDMTPNTKSVSLPKIALSTGNADAIECLIRKLGIADKEISTDGGTGNIHFYTDTGAVNMNSGVGTSSFNSGWPGGTGNFKDSKTLWGSLAKMKAYDIVILSCEGAQHSETKSQADMDALKAYADFGGRVFMSHWHNIWIEGSTQGGGGQKPAVWPGVATWNNNGPDFDSPPGPPDVIDEANNPKGSSFATWMLNVMGSTVRDQIPINTGRNTCSAVDNTKGERWVYWTGNGTVPQNFQFTTPNETSIDQRCGKVVFSDMHVSADSKSGPGMPFPTGCAATLALTPQEKALAFMFFDLSSCIGNIF